MDKCGFCGREGEKETADNLDASVNIKDPVKNPSLLSWLYPDELWICNSCLRMKVSSIPMGGSVHQ